MKNKPNEELKLIEAEDEPKTDHEKLMEAYARLNKKLENIIQRRKDRKDSNRN